MFDVRIAETAIDPQALQAALARDPDNTGALVSFTGYVRGEGIDAMYLEHYPGMTERSIEMMLRRAAARWPLYSLSVVHRVGELLPGDPIVWAGVTSRYRADAFPACEFVMDYLKVEALLWKRERRRDGGDWQWVDARRRDRARAARWDGESAVSVDLERRNVI